MWLIWAVSMSVLYYGSCVAFEWTQNVRLGETAYMLCNDSAVTPTINHTLNWFKESRKGEATRISKGAKYDFVNLNGVANMALEVLNVTIEDFGIYRCDMVNGSPQITHVRKGLNLAGVLYDSLLDKYRRQLEVAGIASGSALGLFILTCSVYKFRYRGPTFGPTLGNASVLESRHVSNVGVYNESFEMAEDENRAASIDEITTKM